MLEGLFFFYSATLCAEMSLTSVKAAIFFTDEKILESDSPHKLATVFATKCQPSIYPPQFPLGFEHDPLGLKQLTGPFIEQTQTKLISETMGAIPSWLIKSICMNGD